MADMLLDTTVFHDYRAGDEGARAIFEQIVSGAVTASISSLTVFELWGYAGMDRRTEISYVGMLSFLEVTPLTAEAAKTAGLWVMSLQDERREGVARSALVAATAKERGEPICTRDHDRYDRFYSELVRY
jgi:predicted nucleic acid-binding protein